MSILNILTAPDNRLRQKSLPVDSVDDTIRGLMKDMLDTMYHDEGVGLAAIQIGVNKRVIVLDLQGLAKENEDNKEYPLFMANPVIISRSEEMVCAREGCLSLPDQSIELERPERIKIQFLDYNNMACEFETGGWLSRVIQHEMDHLDGKLLIDYLSPMKKDVAIRKLQKLKKDIL